VTPRQAFEQYHQAAFSFAWRLTGRQEAAEDLTQECFLALLRAPQRFDEAGCGEESRAEEGGEESREVGPGEPCEEDCGEAEGGQCSDRHRSGRHTVAGWEQPIKSALILDLRLIP
jgi:hypothetical protein